MELHFYKYQGAGNDFVLFDRRENKFSFTKEQIKKICDRKFGIGADGLMFLDPSVDNDFSMTYHNSDGEQGSLCGNGGRCIVKFAKDLGLIGDNTLFSAADGLHKASLVGGLVSLEMNDVLEWKEEENYTFLDTGSPHHIEFVKDVSKIDIPKQGAEIRYSSLYEPNGTNVNFVEIVNDKEIRIRTYERGVEDETLACGTGATAAAIASYIQGKVKSQTILVKVEGGELEVSFDEKVDFYSNIVLKGPAKKVFEGKIEI